LVEVKTTYDVVSLAPHFRSANRSRSVIFYELQSRRGSWSKFFGTVGETRVKKSDHDHLCTIPCKLTGLMTPVEKARYTDSFA